VNDKALLWRADQHKLKVAPVTARDVLRALVEKGLVHPEEFISGSAIVRSASYRNHNYVVETKGGSSYFVKQGITDSTIATIRREAEFYQYTIKSFRAFVKHMPRFVCFIPEACLLVTELVRPGVPLNQLRPRGTGVKVFSRLGAALALLHSKSDFTGLTAGRRPSPFILSIPSLSNSQLTNMSAAGVELARTIQRFSDYEQLLTSSMENPKESCLTHNDFKSANCILGANRKPVLIDWEFAALGDPAWDVGCTFADILSSWLASMPLGSRIGPERLSEVATRPLQMLQPAMQSFWISYSDARELSGDAALSFLLRAAKCAGIKLGQFAYEMCQHSSSLSAPELFYLQTSWNILKWPTEAIVLLLGINLELPTPKELQLGIVAEEMHAGGP
jgi:aminoglycoside phosphotransferase (APT) family kinase protein